MKLEIKGMHCPSCKMLIEDILEDMEMNVETIRVNTEQKIEIILTNRKSNFEEIKKTIEAEGDYEVKLK